jgi:hypothetical protein
VDVSLDDKSPTEREVESQGNIFVVDSSAGQRS